tara:strand:+ start:762 stop:1388 length:627 start_codon:yes stop_codon:yes gene_type:complete
MNISLLLLIDVALIVAAIPILYFHQDKNKKRTTFPIFNEEKLLKKPHYKLPNKNNLLELEKLAKNQGSGIEFDSLIGDWKFISVWKKEIDEVDSLFSSLLQFFSTNLEFKKDISNENLLEFEIITSIKFGIFTIQFSGSCYLRGKQPLLPFFFNLIELKSGSNILLRRSLMKPIGIERSFFELIAMEENGKWLSARGQGGALVLWLKD